MKTYEVVEEKELSTLLLSREKDGKVLKSARRLHAGAWKCTFEPKLEIPVEEKPEANPSPARDKRGRFIKRIS